MGKATISSPATTVTASTSQTPEVTEFLQNRATLAASMEQIVSQIHNGTPNAQALTRFQQKNAALLAQRMHQHTQLYKIQIIREEKS